MKKFLIPFFTAGFPDLNSTAKTLDLLSSAKPDYIEVGLGHSDALADGSVIQYSSQKALENGMNIELLCQQISQCQPHTSKLILFSYYNPLIAYGLDKSLADWKEAGGHSVLIPDLPLEESAEIISLCRQRKLKFIFLIAPTSTAERIREITELSEEFVYLVSRTGVTGSSSDTKLSSSLVQTIKQIKSIKQQLPVVLGFGIRDKLSASEAIGLGADGIVIGSALVSAFGRGEYRAGYHLLTEIQEALS